MTFGIMFHHFSNNGHPIVQGSINDKEFEFIISKLKQNYNLLSAHDYYEAFLSSTLDQNDVCLTFDDALCCQWDVAIPILNKLKITAFWFIYSSVFEGHLENLEIYRVFRNVYFGDIETFYTIFFQYLENSNFLKNDDHKTLLNYCPKSYLCEFSFYTNNDRKFRYIRDVVLEKERYKILMDDLISHYKITKADLAANLWMQNDHLSELHKQGHIIGAHSYSHPTNLKDMSSEDQFNEYDRNIQHIYKITGKNPLCMAHPCNSYNDNVLQILTNLGIKLGFRSNMVKKNFSNLEFPREDHITILKDS